MNTYTYKASVSHGDQNVSRPVTGPMDLGSVHAVLADGHDVRLTGALLRHAAVIAAEIDVFPDPATSQENLFGLVQGYAMNAAGPTEWTVHFPVTLRYSKSYSLTGGLAITLRSDKGTMPEFVRLSVHT